MSVGLHGTAPLRARSLIFDPEMLMKSEGRLSSGTFMTLSLMSYMTLTKLSIFIAPRPGEFRRTYRP